jgi:hypothetical protein
MQQRPAAVRGHIAGQFGLTGTANLTVNVSDTTMGSITVNTLAINPATVGVATNPYPWTGAYFQNVPVPVTAVPKPGYRFVSWTDSGSTNTNLVTTLAADSTSGYDGWGNGSNRGFGFQPWSFVETESWDDGFFVGNSGRAIHGVSPDGRSFGIFAHSGGSASATRVFSGGNLGTNQTFSATVSHGSFNGQKGVSLGAAGVNRISFYSGTGSGQSRYYFRHQGTTAIITNRFSADTNSTFEFSVTHLGTNVHRVTIARGETTFTTNVTLSGALDRATFYNTNSAGSDDVHNLYFNNDRSTGRVSYGQFDGGSDPHGQFRSRAGQCVEHHAAGLDGRIRRLSDCCACGQLPRRYGPELHWDSHADHYRSWRISWHLHSRGC